MKSTKSDVEQARNLFLGLFIFMLVLWTLSLFFYLQALDNLRTQLYCGGKGYTYTDVYNESNSNEHIGYRCCYDDKDSFFNSSTGFWIHNEVQRCKFVVEVIE